jgi:type VI secretion system protein VasI
MLALRQLKEGAVKGGRRSLILWAVATGLLILWGAPGQGASDGKECAAIKDDGKRLECYDLLFRSTVTVEPSDPESRWRVKTETSKIDDSKNVFMSLEAKDPHRNRFGEAEHPTLLIACRENVTNLWIWFAGEFMSDLQGRGRVTYRIDKQEARSRSFRESNDHVALGLWSGGAAIPFIKEMFGASWLFVRAVPFSESAVTAEFPIAGIEEAITPLREACHW